MTPLDVCGGFTWPVEKNLLVRLRVLSTMWPAPLKLLGVIKGNVETLDFRLGGEWFRPSPGLLDFIRSSAIRPEARGTAERPGR